jgi:hypothetical protein
VIYCGQIPTIAAVGAYLPEGLVIHLGKISRKLLTIIMASLLSHERISLSWRFDTVTENMTCSWADNSNGYRVTTGAKIITL